jgi:hypothetical protein
LRYNRNLLVENRSGLIVTMELFQSNGAAERDAALVMLEQIPGEHRVTVGADKAYGARDFVQECRNLRVMPRVAQNTKRSGGSAIDERTTRLQRGTIESTVSATGAYNAVVTVHVGSQVSDNIKALVHVRLRK